MDKNRIEQVLETQGLTSNQIAEVIGELSSFDGGDLDPTSPSVQPSVSQVELELKSRMDGEKDWRMRAKLAAQIISANLE